MVAVTGQPGMKTFLWNDLNFTEVLWIALKGSFPVSASERKKLAANHEMCYEVLIKLFEIRIKSRLTAENRTKLIFIFSNCIIHT